MSKLVSCNVCLENITFSTIHALTREKNLYRENETHHINFSRIIYCHELFSALPHSFLRERIQSGEGKFICKTSVDIPTLVVYLLIEVIYLLHNWKFTKKVDWVLSTEILSVSRLNLHNKSLN